MSVLEFVNTVLLPFGGVSFVLIALASFLGNINTKRIVNGDLAKHKLALEEFKKESTKELTEIKNIHNKEIEFMKGDVAKNIELMRGEHASSIEVMKCTHAANIEIMKAEHVTSIELLQSQFKTEFLKQETYSSISKEKFQELFERRITVYEEFLNLKREIDKSIVDNAADLEINNEDPTHFADMVSKVSEASQKNSLLISNELAELSNELNKRSNQVFSNANVQELLAEMQSYDSMEQDQPDYQAMIDARNTELQDMFTECIDIYEKWFEQLNIDVSNIRSILDMSNRFLDSKKTIN